MKRIIVLLMVLLTFPPEVTAQTQGLLPWANQSANVNEDLECNGFSGVVLCFPGSVAVGDFIIGVFEWDRNACTSNTPSDTLSTSFTISTITDLFPGFGGHGGIEFFWGVATSAGTERISPSCSLSLSLTNAVGGTFKNMPSTITTDGFSPNTYSPPGGSTITDSVITAANGDLIVNATWCNNATQTVMFNQQQFFGNANVLEMGWENVGAAGSISESVASTCSGGGVFYHGMAAFKTTAQIGTTAFAEGEAGSPYRAQITSTNWTGTRSFTASPLPTGMTCNATTGLISGTPLSSGTFSTVVSDGTSSATISLVMHNAATKCTPMLVSEQNNFASTWVLTSVVSGDVIIFPALGHSSAGTGWIEPVASITDTCGDTYHYLYGTAPNKGGGNAIYWTTATCSGTVTVTDTPFCCGSMIGGIAEDWRNIQTVIDFPNWSVALIPSPSGTLTNSGYTINDPNSVLESFATGTNNPGGFSVTIGSPWTAIDHNYNSFAVLATAQRSPAAQGSFTATASYSNSGQTEVTAITVFELHPKYDDGNCNGIVRHHEQWIDQF